MYRVNIPNFASGETTAVTPESALSMFIIREMRKKDSNVWWKGRQYRGLVGERALIEDVLYSSDHLSYVTAIPNKAIPKEDPIPQPFTPVQLQFTNLAAIDIALEGGYDEGFVYELHLKDKKIRASNSKDFEALKTKHLASTYDYAPVLHIWSVNSKEHEIYRTAADSILDHIEEDPTVLSLLKECNVSIGDLQDIDIKVSPYQSCEVPARVTKEAIQIGYCREVDSANHMYETCILGLTEWLQAKNGQNAWPEVKLVRGREKQLLTSLDRLAGKAEAKGLTSIELEDIIRGLGIPRVAVYNYLEEAKHPYFTFKDISLAPHAVECILDRFKVFGEAKIIAVDFDGTIASGSAEAFPAIGEPEPGVVEALSQLEKEGWEILVFSCRAKEAGQIQVMEKYLKEHKIPFNQIWKGGDKPQAVAFIDDKAIQYKGDWKEVVKEVQQKKVSAKLNCEACKLNQIWYPEKQMWKCVKCNNNMILEKAAIWLYALKPNQSVKYTIGKQAFTSTLANTIGNSIWKTQAGHLVHAKALTCYVEPELKLTERWIEHA